MMLTKDQAEAILVANPHLKPIVGALHSALEIKKLIAEFREYQDSPECAMMPLTEALDLVEKIEVIVEGSDNADNQT